MSKLGLVVFLFVVKLLVIFGLKDLGFMSIG